MQGRCGVGIEATSKVAIGELLVEQQPDDPQPHRVCQRPRLLKGRSPKLPAGAVA
jgi:hypothetical protein